QLARLLGLLPGAPGAPGVVTVLAKRVAGLLGQVCDLVEFVGETAEPGVPVGSTLDDACLARHPLPGGDRHRCAAVLDRGAGEPGEHVLPAGAVARKVEQAQDRAAATREARGSTERPFAGMLAVS